MRPVIVHQGSSQWLQNYPRSLLCALILIFFIPNSLIGISRDCWSGYRRGLGGLWAVPVTWFISVGILCVFLPVLGLCGFLRRVELQ